MHSPLFLILHVIVSLLLAYISYLIIKKETPPSWMGILLAIVTIAMISTHVYTFTTETKDSFCMCSGAQTASAYQNRQTAQELYRKGLLTEYTNLKRNVSNPLTF